MKRYALNRNFTGMDLDNRKKMTPENVVKILSKHGTQVSVEEAVVIIKFLKKLANIAVNQYLADTKQDH